MTIPADLSVLLDRRALIRPVAATTLAVATNLPMGHYEGIPRVLDLMDKHGIKLSSFMIGRAVETRARCFLEYAQSKGGVWFAPKDEIARFVIEQRGHTPVIDRGPANRTGLPGPG